MVCLVLSQQSCLRLNKYSLLNCLNLHTFLNYDICIARVLEEKKKKNLQSECFAQISRLFDDLN